MSSFSQTHERTSLTQAEADAERLRRKGRKRRGKPGTEVVASDTATSASSSSLASGSNAIEGGSSEDEQRVDIDARAGLSNICKKAINQKSEKDQGELYALRNGTRLRRNGQDWVVYRDQEGSRHLGLAYGFDEDKEYICSTSQGCICPAKIRITRCESLPDPATGSITLIGRFEDKKWLYPGGSNSKILDYMFYQDIIPADAIEKRLENVELFAKHVFSFKLQLGDGQSFRKFDNTEINQLKACVCKALHVADGDLHITQIQESSFHGDSSSYNTFMARVRTRGTTKSHHILNQLEIRGAESVRRMTEVRDRSSINSDGHESGLQEENRKYKGAVMLELTKDIFFQGLQPWFKEHFQCLFSHVEGPRPVCRDHWEGCLDFVSFAFKDFRVRDAPEQHEARVQDGPTCCGRDCQCEIFFCSQIYDPNRRRRENHSEEVDVACFNSGCSIDSKKLNQALMGEAFAGIGMASRGYEQSKFKPRFGAEKEKIPHATLTRNMPEAALKFRGTMHWNVTEGGLKDFKPGELWSQSAEWMARCLQNFEKPVSFFAASPPCQKFSAANHAATKANNEDARTAVERAREEDESLSNSKVAKAVAYAIISNHLPYFAIENVIAFYGIPGAPGDMLCKTLQHAGYQTQLVTTEAGQVGNLSRRVRSFLIGCRQDMAMPVLPNPPVKMKAPYNIFGLGGKGKSHGEVGSRKFLNQTRLSPGDNATDQTHYKKGEYTALFEKRLIKAIGNYHSLGFNTQAGIQIGFCAPPTSFEKCFDNNGRTLKETEDCMIYNNGRLGKTMMTTPTHAGRAPNELRSPILGLAKISVLSPAEAAVLMGVQRLIPPESKNDEKQFFLLPKGMDCSCQQNYNAAWRGVGNGVPVPLAHFVGKAIMETGLKVSVRRLKTLETFGLQKYLRMRKNKEKAKKRQQQKVEEGKKRRRKSNSNTDALSVIQNKMFSKKQRTSLGQ